MAALWSASCGGRRTAQAGKAPIRGAMWRLSKPLPGTAVSRRSKLEIELRVGPGTLESHPGRKLQCEPGMARSSDEAVAWLVAVAVV